MSYAPAPYGFSYVPAAPGAAVTATDGPGAPHPWKESSFSFHDVLDALNPLQHIPIVNTIYRWATGDVPGNIARVVGDGLYGGPIGLAAGMLSVAVKDDTGKDPGEMVMGLLTGGDTAEVKLGSAAALPAAPASAAASAAATAALPATATLPTASSATRASAATAAAMTPAPRARAPMMPSLQAAPAMSPAPGTASPAEQAFASQNGALLRSAYGERAAPPAHAMVPLQLTGAQLPPRFTRSAAPAATPAAPAGSTAPAAAPQPGAAAPQAAPPAAPTAQAAPQPDLSALPENPPVDIPQRMMDALDKYAHIHQQQQRGQQVDVAP